MALGEFLILRRPRKRPSRRTHGADPALGFLPSLAAPATLLPALRRSAAIGLACGAGAVHLAVVGVLLMLHQRAIIVGGLSLGQAALLLIAAEAGLMAARNAGVVQGLLSGMISGAACGLPIAALTGLIGLVPLR